MWRTAPWSFGVVPYFGRHLDFLVFVLGWPGALLHCFGSLKIPSLLWKTFVTLLRHPRRTGTHERYWLCAREPGSWVEYSSRYLAAG